MHGVYLENIVSDIITVGVGTLISSHICCIARVIAGDLE